VKAFIRVSVTLCVWTCWESAIAPPDSLAVIRERGGKKRVGNSREGRKRREWRGVKG